MLFLVEVILDPVYIDYTVSDGREIVYDELKRKWKRSWPIYTHRSIYLEGVSERKYGKPQSMASRL
jgi:hypothetical protein